MPAEQFVENPAKKFSDRQIAPQRCRGLVDVRQNAANLIGEHGC